MDIKDLLGFDKMFTPRVITIIYWILLGLVVLSGLITLFTSGMNGIWMGPVIIVFGTLGVRIYCELLILFFKIHEELQEIRKKS
jgi:hypothetical protein